MSYPVACTTCGQPTTQSLNPEKHGVFAFCEACRSANELEEAGNTDPKDAPEAFAEFRSASVAEEAKPSETVVCPNPEIAAVLAGERRWCVIEGDCLDVLPTIPGVDHVLTDPPYEAEAHTLGRRVKTADRGGT